MACVKVMECVSTRGFGIIISDSSAGTLESLLLDFPSLLRVQLSWDMFFADPVTSGEARTAALGAIVINLCTRTQQISVLLIPEMYYQYLDPQVY